MLVSIENFYEEKKCNFKEESYSVRDNGAVLRHAKETIKPRPTDNKWTFGKLNQKTGYLEIASVRIHRIVATAFHGDSPTEHHVADHIDTNRQNNRPDNLRWITKLENALNNPITRKRIIIQCGSIEAFLKNPSLLKETTVEPNFSWMRRVSREEANNCLHRLNQWAESDEMPKGGNIGEWIYEETRNKYYHTNGTAQRNWATPSEFPNCPTIFDKNPLEKYSENLKQGKIFSRNQYGESEVVKTVLLNDPKLLLVLTKSSESLKPYALAKVIYENEIFIHESLGSFFSFIGVEKQFIINQGLEWTGEDSVDDYS